MPGVFPGIIPIRRRPGDLRPRVSLHRSPQCNPERSYNFACILSARRLHPHSFCVLCVLLRLKFCRSGCGSAAWLTLKFFVASVDFSKGLILHFGRLSIVGHSPSDLLEDSNLNLRSIRLWRAQLSTGGGWSIWLRLCRLVVQIRKILQLRVDLFRAKTSPTLLLRPLRPFAATPSRILEGGILWGVSAGCSTSNFLPLEMRVRGPTPALTVRFGCGSAALRLCRRECGDRKLMLLSCASERPLTLRLV